MEKKYPECNVQWHRVEIVNACVAISFTTCISVSTLYTSFVIFCRRQKSQRPTYV